MLFPLSSPIFVVGVGRSGTSLLQSMLHAHSQVSFLPETHFFRSYVARGIDRMRWQMRGIGKLAQQLQQDPDIARADVSVSQLLEPCTRGGKIDLGAAYRHLLSIHGKREGVSRVGAKDPRLLDYLPQLRRVCPNACVIHIVRDPRDVLLSRRKATWSAGRPDLLHLLTYRAQMRWGRAEGRKAFGSQFVEVRYEDLLREPEATLQRLSDRVGIDYEPQMLAFASSAEELVSDRERDWKSETMGPLLQDNMEKWKGTLSPFIVGLTETLCEEAFTAFGYQRADSSDRMSKSEGRICRLLKRMAPISDVAYIFRREFS